MISGPDDVTAKVLSEVERTTDPRLKELLSAGVRHLHSFVRETKLTEAEFEAHWREHALGAFQLAQAALPPLVARGEGSLFFTGASGSLRGKANFAPFAAAKGALRNLTQSLAREFGPQGIHVGHVIVDGGISGERLLSRMPQLKDQRGPDGMLNIDAIADAYWAMHQQHRSAWTLELDVRPWAENF